MKSGVCKSTIIEIRKQQKYLCIDKFHICARKKNQQKKKSEKKPVQTHWFDKLFLHDKLWFIKKCAHD